MSGIELQGDQFVPPVGAGAGGSRYYIHQSAIRDSRARARLHGGHAD